MLAVSAGRLQTCRVGHCAILLASRPLGTGGCHTVRYAELISLYFDRSNALQWYWTIYVVIIGGLLAFSSLRQRPDAVTAILVSVLYVFFAYKNLGAIRDVSFQRYAVLALIKEVPADVAAQGGLPVTRHRELLEPTLVAPSYDDVRNFHVASDVLTLAAVWAMEWRRRRHAHLVLAAPSPGPDRRPD